MMMMAISVQKIDDNFDGNRDADNWESYLNEVD